FNGSTKRSGVRTATPTSPAAASRTSWAVTTLLFLLLRRSLLGLGGRAGSVFVVRVAVAVFRLVFLHDPGHVHEQIARGQVHHLHALRIATRDADALDRHADHDSLLGDHHQLVVGEHLFEGDEVAGLVRTLQRDDAPSAAVLHAVLVELGALAHPLFGDDEQRRLAPHHDHVDHVVLLVELDPLHAGRRAAHVPHVLLVEPDAHPVAGGEHDVVPAVGDLHVDQLVALLDVDGADPDRARIAELRQDGLLDDALRGGEQQELILGEFPYRHEGGQAFVRFHADARDDRLAARRACRLRDLMNLEPVALPLLREEHDVIVRRGDEQVLEPVVFFGVGGDDALAAASLPAVRGDREPLDVAGVGHGDDHVLFGDQVLDRELALVGDDLGAALVAEAVRQLRQLLLEDLEAPRLGAEDLLALLDELASFRELVLELGVLEGGEPGEPHVEDLGRLLLRQLEALAQGRVGRRHVLRLTNDLHHLVDVVKIIRKAKDVPTADAALRKRFKLSEKQAAEILNMRLARLTALEDTKLEDELTERRKFIKECKEILGSKPRRLKILKEELSELAHGFGDERRTEIVADQGEFSIEDLIAEEDMVITVSHAGYIKRLPVSAYRRQRRGGK